MNFNLEISFVQRGVENLISFRSRHESNLGKISTVFGGIGLGLAGLIETISSFALSLLTLPARLVGSDLSEKFYSRACSGINMTAISATLLQYYNIFGTARDFQTE